MNYHSQIRERFVPFQPSAGRFKSQVDYIEYKPHEKLQDFIYCYWQLKTNLAMDYDFSYRVVSDGCIDIFFDLEQPAENFVMGLATNYVQFAVGKKFNYVGVRFFPSVFPELFQIEASSITNQYVPLIDISPKVSDFISRNISLTQIFNEIATSFDDFFIHQIENRAFDFDPRFYEAFIRLLENRGCAEISELAVGLSLRQLRRLFNFYVGTSPKTFSKIVRFQHVLAAKPSRESLRHDKIFYDLGYFDQAHFIRDFKAFYGLTPSKAVD